MLLGSGSTFPEVDPDPAKWYGSVSGSGSETLIIYTNKVDNGNNDWICKYEYANKKSDFLNFLALLHLHDMRGKQQGKHQITRTRSRGFSGKASNKKRFT